MRYPEELVEEVRLRNDIVDVVGGYVKLKRQGSSYFGLCPFHNEKSPSFSVSPSKQIFYCFGCGAGGNVFNFIQKYENYTYPEASSMMLLYTNLQILSRGQPKILPVFLNRCRPPRTALLHRYARKRERCTFVQRSPG